MLDHGSFAIFTDELNLSNTEWTILMNHQLLPPKKNYPYLVADLKYDPTMPGNLAVALEDYPGIL